MRNVFAALYKQQKRTVKDLIAKSFQVAKCLYKVSLRGVGKLIFIANDCDLWVIWEAYVIRTAFVLSEFVRRIWFKRWIRDQNYFRRTLHVEIFSQSLNHGTIYWYSDSLQNTEFQFNVMFIFVFSWTNIWHKFGSILITTKNKRLFPTLKWILFFYYLDSKKINVWNLKLNIFDIQPKLVVKIATQKKMTVIYTTGN